MKFLGKIEHSKDVVNKEYVDNFEQHRQKTVYIGTNHASDTGWYRCAHGSNKLSGGSMFLVLRRNYNYSRSESYLYCITWNYTTVEISLLSGVTDHNSNIDQRLLDKIRVDLLKADVYVDFHVGISKPSNTYAWYVIGEGEALDAEFNPTTVGTLTEFENVWGFKASNAAYVGSYGVWHEGNLDKASVKSILGISDWALASSKPAYSFTEITSKPTTLSGYGITDAVSSSTYTASNILTKLKNVDGVGSGLDADLLDGYEGTVYFRQDRGWATVNLDDLPSVGLYGVSSANVPDISTYPDTYGVVANFGKTAGGYTGLQLFAPYTGDALRFRVYWSNKWNPVCTLATLDSNVASATKLQTSRTIWGQSFNGTANISGDMTGVSRIYRESGKGTYLHQNTAPSTLETLGAAVGIGRSFDGYGTYIWGTDNGNGHIQVGRSDGKSQYYNLLLQEFGGYVGIGKSPTKTLDVNGTFAVSGDSSLNSTTVAGNLSVKGTVSLERTLEVSGETTLKNTVHFSDPMYGLYSMTRSGGWAHTFAGYKGHDSKEILARFGGYGNNEDFYYFYLGKAYNDTWMVVNKNSVGIGTASPNAAYKLHVDGDGYTSGNLLVGGAITGAGNINSSGSFFNNGYESVGYVSLSGEEGPGASIHLGSGSLDMILRTKADDLYHWNAETDQYSKLLHSLNFTDYSIRAVLKKQASTNLLENGDKYCGSESYLIGLYTYNEEVQNGKKYKLTICAKLGDEVTHIDAYWDGGVGGNYTRITDLSSQEERIVEVVATITNKNNLAFYQFPNGKFGSYIKWAHLEEVKEDDEAESSNPKPLLLYSLCNLERLDFANAEDGKRISINRNGLSFCGAKTEAEAEISVKGYDGLAYLAPLSGFVSESNELKYLYYGGGGKDSAAIYILPNKYVGIGEKTPAYNLHVSGTGYVSSNLLVGGAVTMYSARSLKNIVDEKGLSLQELQTIRPTRFTWKDGRDSRIHVGGIADDVMKVLPEVVYKNAEGALTMDYGNAAFAMAASLVKPVSEHERKIELLEQEIARLKQHIEKLKNESL